MRKPVSVVAHRRRGRAPLVAGAAAIAVVAGLLALALAGSGGGRGRVVGATGRQGSPNVGDAELLPGGHGWALTTGGLLWTDDSGASWRDVTPSGAAPSTITGVAFRPDGHGWAAAADQSGGKSTLRVFRRAGTTWASSAAPAPRPVMGRYGPASISFVDALHGWMLVDIGAHGPFSPGALFRTTDGGATWSRQAAPASGRIRFVSPAMGFLAAPPNGPKPSTLYVTRDGGSTWVPASLPAPARHAADTAVVDAPPVTSGPAASVIVGWVDRLGNRSGAGVYSSGDGGRTWSLVDDKPAPAGAASFAWAGLAGTPGLQISWSGPAGTWMASSADGGRSFADKPAKGVSALTSLSFGDVSRLWAVAPAGTSRTSALFQSTDAGASWTQVRVSP